MLEIVELTFVNFIWTLLEVAFNLQMLHLAFKKLSSKQGLYMLEFHIFLRIW